MTEKSIEKAQFEAILKEDKVIISDSEAIDEFFRNSYIGNLEQTKEGQEILVLDPVEVLLLIERNRLLIWENNNKNQEQFNFEKLLEYFVHYDNRLWHKYIIYMDFICLWQLSNNFLVISGLTNILRIFFIATTIGLFPAFILAFLMTARELYIDIAEKKLLERGINPNG